jgi:hypothetical protein
MCVARPRQRQCACCSHLSVHLHTPASMPVPVLAAAQVAAPLVRGQLQEKASSCGIEEESAGRADDETGMATACAASFVSLLVDHDSYSASEPDGWR